LRRRDKTARQSRNLAEPEAHPGAGKTLPAIVTRLNREIPDALKDPETRTLLESQAMQIVGSSPEAFASFIKQDIAIWKEVADQAKIEVR